MTRDYYQSKMKSAFEISSDEGFLQLAWATNALQSGGAETAFRYLQRATVPENAVSEKISNQLAIHPWELETLVNELLTTEKRIDIQNGRERELNTANFQNIIRSTNHLRKLENIEYRIGPKQDSIYMEMARIANRQFDWQRGYFNIPQFYRNAFVYGQGTCAAYFEEKHGITVNQFSLIGFAIFVALTEQPTFGIKSSLQPIGLSQSELDQTLALITQPIAQARISAKATRKNIFHTAYRPSILRMKPCITFAPGYIRCPLPELLLERVTSGVFYDVVGGSGPVRNDYGRRFEEYCFQYLSQTLPGLNWQKEKQYRLKPNNYDTPDILCGFNESLTVAIECKASRMSYDARFGNDPFEEFEDIIKAVFQLWRFFSHSRRGLTGYTIAPDAVGLVLTLESWLTMAMPLRDKVMAAATKMATDRDPQIIEDDRRPISFVAVTDLEHTLEHAAEPMFLDAVRQSAAKYACWHLDSVYRELHGRGPNNRDYPFASRVGEVLPWWNMMEETKALSK